MQKLLIRISYFLLVLCLPVYADTVNVTIRGLSGEAVNNAQARLKSLEELQGKPLTPEKIQSFYQNASQEIRQAIQPFGYFNARISSRLTRRGQVWSAQFYVQPGIPTRITGLDLKVMGEGANNSELSNFIADFPIERGEIFNTDEYEKAKEKLLQIAINQGYIRATLSNNQILIDKARHQAKIIIHLQTGPRYYFGRIHFDSSVYNEPFLYRFVNVKPTQPFSGEKLTALQQELANSFYFQQVLVTPDFNNIEDHHVPINISVVAPKSQRYKFGIGYGTFTGPRLTAGVSLRRITNSGHHFDAQLRLSQVVSGLAAKYYIPGKNPLTDQWIMGANYQKFAPKEGKSISQTFSVAYDKKTPKWQNNLSLNYLIDRYSLTDQSGRKSNLLYPAWNVSYLDVDDLINTKFGKSINLILQGASGDLLSSTSFLQANIKGKYVFTPTDFARFIVRGELGYTMVKDLAKLPLTMRFFAGGTNSVRGYQESSIGPGKYLEVASVEYQNHLFGNWTGAVFYDIGAASNTFNKGYNNGKGVGLVYSSVIGPVKFYVAKGDEGKLGFEFSIGPEF